MDAFGLADAVGETDGRGSNVGSRLGVRRVSGSGDRVPRGLTGATLPADGMIGSPDARWPWAASALTPCSPVTVTIVALTAATIHTATAAAAVALPGLARILLQLSRPRIRRRPRGPSAAASRASLPRDAAVALAVARSSIGSRSPAGSSASGSRRDSISGRSAPCLWLAHVSQCSRCLAVSRPACTVSCPSQSASKAASSGHDSRPVRAMSNASRAVSRCSRAWVARVCARLQETSSTAASSASSRLCRTLSSMTSCSCGFSSARVSRISRRTSASSAA